ncbi:unnamed protein product [Arctia plantaginis]|uniref:Uncharacterized protein n=1 Tax=Arctia plantaginis TaxID=874455 RepID=A0A8S1BN42_ARCPL|nr:unnamed protein product [Arctia plantaginis]
MWSVRRPRYRWKDKVTKEILEIQMFDWSGLAQNRKEWRILMSEVKTHFDFQHCMPAERSFAAQRRRRPPALARPEQRLPTRDVQNMN